MQEVHAELIEAKSRASSMSFQKGAPPPPGPAQGVGGDWAGERAAVCRSAEPPAGDGSGSVCDGDAGPGSLRREGCGAAMEGGAWARGAGRGMGLCVGTALRACVSVCRGAEEVERRLAAIAGIQEERQAQMQLLQARLRHVRAPTRPRPGPATFRAGRRTLSSRAWGGRGVCGARGGAVGVGRAGTPARLGGAARLAGRGRRISPWSCEGCGARLGSANAWGRPVQPWTRAHQHPLPPAPASFRQRPPLDRGPPRAFPPLPPPPGGPCSPTGGRVQPVRGTLQRLGYSLSATRSSGLR